MDPIRYYVWIESLLGCSRFRSTHTSLLLHVQSGILQNRNREYGRGVSKVLIPRTTTASGISFTSSSLAPIFWPASSNDSRKNCLFCSPQAPQLIGLSASCCRVSIVTLKICKMMKKHSLIYTSLICACRSTWEQIWLKWLLERLCKRPFD